MNIKIFFMNQQSDNLLKTNKILAKKKNNLPLKVPLNPPLIALSLVKKE
jgi:hypothetical protein